MAGSIFGTHFQLVSFGESHGTAIGGVIQGCPAGLPVDLDFIQQQLDRRKPGQSKIVTQRKESDRVQFLSGIFDGKTTGTPIGFLILNEDQRSADYSHNQTVYRPSHADYTYEVKYGIRDHRGGGRSSARETACRVVAGAIAQLLLKQEGIRIRAYTSQIGDIQLLKNWTELNLDSIDDSLVRCPDALISETMISRIEQIRKEGDSLGGVITCVVTNVPAGLGEPVFDKLHADLGKAMLSINAVKGFEYGSGFDGTRLKGSEHNDAFVMKDNAVRTSSNHSGGIQGGISNGEPIYFRVAFKPTATIVKEQQTVSSLGDETRISGKGRHDPCVVPRAVPIIESMAALVIADHYLRNKTAHL